MLSIQEAGIQILGDNPGNFYIFGGHEYGIKVRYIDILSNKFGPVVECPSVIDTINMLSKKHIVPLAPAVYVIRYDESFVAAVSDIIANRVRKLKFNGVIICIYESAKHLNKLEKYLGDYTVMIDSFSPQFVHKYLRTDFPNLDDKLISVAVDHADNYNQAKNMCMAMNSIPNSSFAGRSEDDIAWMFGCSDSSTEMQIRRGVASRNFKSLVECAETYEDTPDRIFYAILSTMIELDKLLDNKRIPSDIQSCTKYWSRQDVYYMFMNTYDELKKSRSCSGYDIKLRLIYLFGLLRFQPIPSPEVMNS